MRQLDQTNSQNSKVPALLPKSRSVQLIDVRDAADFALNCAEKNVSGILNVTGNPFPLFELLGAIAEIAGSKNQVNWVTKSQMDAAEVKPWSDMPLITPHGDNFEHFLDVSNEKAKNVGLKCCSLEQTLIPIIEWDRQRRDIALKTGMSPEQRAKLMA